MLEKECPDVVIIAGDIYDRSVPPAEAVELLDQVLNKIVFELKDTNIGYFRKSR